VAPRIAKLLIDDGDVAYVVFFLKLRSYWTKVNQIFLHDVARFAIFHSTKATNEGESADFAHLLTLKLVAMATFLEPP